MAKLPPEVIEVFNDTEGSTKMMATLGKDFRVNSVVVASFYALSDESLMFAHMFIKKTKQNLNDNPKIAVTAFRPPATAYEVKGTLTEWQTSGPLYRMVADGIYEKMPIQIQGVGMVQVDEVYSIAPDGQETKLA